MGFKRPEVQIFSPRPIRRKCKAFPTVFLYSCEESTRAWFWVSKQRIRSAEKWQEFFSCFSLTQYIYNCSCKSAHLAIFCTFFNFWRYVQMLIIPDTDKITIKEKIWITHIGDNSCWGRGCNHRKSWYWRWWRGLIHTIRDPQRGSAHMADTW